MSDKDGAKYPAPTKATSKPAKTTKTAPAVESDETNASDS
jgi:hypothetical protein